MQLGIGTTLLSKGLSLSYRGGNLNSYPLLEERFLSNLSWLQFQIMLCRVALPSHACEKLDKVNRDFLWGSSTEKRKLHLVGWSKIIRPKDEGGLNIQAVRAKNIALLAKVNWRLYQDKDSL